MTAFVFQSLTRIADGAGQWAVVAQGAYTAAPVSKALRDIDVYPLLGPMGGGTEIMLEVSCAVFTSILWCIVHAICHLAENRIVCAMRRSCQSVVT